MISKKMDICFFGGLYPDKYYSEIFLKSKKGLQNAANNLQWSIINGLEANTSEPVKIINLMFIGSYPRKYKDMMIKEFNFQHSINSSNKNLGFINLSLIKEFSRLISIKKYIKNNKKSLSNKVILLYSIQSVWLTAAKMIKKLRLDSHICMIVPDLPNFMSMEYDNRVLYRLYKKYLVRKTNKFTKYLDSFVYLTEEMKFYFDLKKPYTVVEGMKSIDLLNEKQMTRYIDKEKKTIVYSGSLTKKYGVLDLLEAFMTIQDNNYSLVICGEGETKDLISEYTKKDNRMEYLGLLKKEEVIFLQQHATVLVNPRKNDGEYTKYSFPSKIIEYLSSGTPVIAYKLDGIPNEYDEYIYYINTASTNNMAAKIIEICEKPISERFEFGLKARNFILEKKNPKVQTKKIIDMISKSAQN